MNILIVNYEYPPLGGGGGVATKELAEELATRHTVHILTSAFADLPKNEVTKNVVIHRVPVLGRVYKPTATIISMITFFPTAFLRGLFLCRTYSFDVINAQFVLPSGAPAALLAFVFRLPFVLSFIGGDVYDPSKGVSPHRHGLLRWAIRWISNRATTATAISSDTKQRAMQLHKVSVPITITPIGLVPQQFSEKTRAELSLPTGPLAVSIGRLIHRKGFEKLLEAWREVPNASLAIIGSGPRRNALRKLIASHGLQNRVFLLGSLSDEHKYQVLRSADFYISTAQHEGFGIVFLEAMAAGLPIIAPVIGGQTDFLRNKEHALLVDSSKVPEIVQAIHALTSDDTLRGALAARNEQDIQEYLIDKTSKTFEDVLQRAIAQHTS